MDPIRDSVLSHRLRWRSRNFGRRDMLFRHNLSLATLFIATNQQQARRRRDAEDHAKKCTRFVTFCFYYVFSATISSTNGVTMSD